MKPPPVGRRNPWEPLEITEKSISWRSMKLLLSDADKRRARPSDTIGLIKPRRQRHLNSDPAFGGKKSTDPSGISLTAQTEKVSTVSEKRTKKNERHRRTPLPTTSSHTRAHTPHTHFLYPVHCVQREEKAGPADRAVMRRYFRISLFVLGGGVGVKCSSRVRQEAACTGPQTASRQHSGGPAPTISLSPYMIPLVSRKTKAYIWIWGERHQMGLLTVYSSTGCLNMRSSSLQSRGPEQFLMYLGQRLSCWAAPSGSGASPARHLSPLKHPSRWCTPRRITHPHSFSKLPLKCILKYFYNTK